ncbi:regulator of G-protein signaling 3, partial [Striga asiatica]
MWAGVFSALWPVGRAVIGPCWKKPCARRLSRSCAPFSLLVLVHSSSHRLGLTAATLSLAAVWWSMEADFLVPSSLFWGWPRLESAACLTCVAVAVCGFEKSKRGFIVFVETDPGFLSGGVLPPCSYNPPPRLRSPSPETNSAKQAPSEKAPVHSHEYPAAAENSRWRWGRCRRSTRPIVVVVAARTAADVVCCCSHRRCDFGRAGGDGVQRRIVDVVGIHWPARRRLVTRMAAAAFGDEDGGGAAEDE